MSQNKKYNPKLVTKVECYSQAATATEKLAAYFVEQGWVLREDIPEDLLVAYGLMNSLTGRLGTPKVLEVMEDTSTKFVEVYHD